MARRAGFPHDLDSRGWLGSAFVTLGLVYAVQGWWAYLRRYHRQWEVVVVDADPERAERVLHRELLPDRHAAKARADDVRRQVAREG